MNDTVILAIIVGLPPTIAACTAAYVAVRTARSMVKVQENVEKIERQTNSMNSQMVASAEIKGEKAGREKAEAVAAVTAAGVAAAAPALAVAPNLPILIQPASSDAEILKWIQQGIAIEKSRREGNGPKT